MCICSHSIQLIHVQMNSINIHIQCPPSTYSPNDATLIDSRVTPWIKYIHNSTFLATAMPHFFPELAQLPTAIRSNTNNNSSMMNTDIPNDDTLPLSPRANITNQSSPRHTKQRSTLIAVGGFVVGASAMAIVLGLHEALQHNDEPAHLRGNDSSYLPPDTTNGADSSNAASFRHGHVSSGSNDSIQATQILSIQDHQEVDSIETPTAAPSTIAISSPYPTYMPTEQVETLFPTYQPTFEGQFPTEVPTTQGELVASNVITSNSILRSIEVGVRLKLYWEQGYFWQENEEEKW